MLDVTSYVWYNYPKKLGNMQKMYAIHPGKALKKCTYT